MCGCKFTNSYDPLQCTYMFIKNVRNKNDNDNDKQLFDIMATGPKSPYVTTNISTEHVIVY